MRNMTDIGGGKFTVDQVKQEIVSIFKTYRPTRLVIDVKLTQDGYFTVFYIPEKDFMRKGVL